MDWEQNMSIEKLWQQKRDKEIKAETYHARFAGYPGDVKDSVLVRHPFCNWISSTLYSNPGPVVCELSLSVSVIQNVLTHFTSFVHHIMRLLCDYAPIGYEAMH